MIPTIKLYHYLNPIKWIPFAKAMYYTLCIPPSPMKPFLDQIANIPKKHGWQSPAGYMTQSGEFTIRNLNKLSLRDICELLNLQMFTTVFLLRDNL